MRAERGRDIGRKKGKGKGESRQETRDKRQNDWKGIPLYFYRERKLAKMIPQRGLSTGGDYTLLIHW